MPPWQPSANRRVVGQDTGRRQLRQRVRKRGAEEVQVRLGDGHQPLGGIEFSELQRPDECCGFGGTFAINEEAVSCQMGLDRIADHQQAGTKVMTAPDMSCLMHLEGLLRRQGSKMHVMHIAQILAGRDVPNGS